jgi:hypothetical protein
MFSAKHPLDDRAGEDDPENPEGGRMKHRRRIPKAPDSLPVRVGNRRNPWFCGARDSEKVYFLRRSVKMLPLAEWRCRMNWRTILFVILTVWFAALFGSLAMGEEEVNHKWLEYIKDGRGVTYFYDKENITYPSSGIIKVWRKREFPVRSGQKAIVTLDEIDCFNQKYHSLQIQVVRWDDTVETFNRVQDWITIWGETPEEWFLDNSCKEVRKKK